MSGGGVARAQLENNRVLGRIRRGARMDVVGESNAERRESLGGSCPDQLGTVRYGAIRYETRTGLSVPADLPLAFAGLPPSCSAEQREVER